MFKVLTAISAIGAVYADPDSKPKPKCNKDHYDEVELKSVLYRMIGNMTEYRIIDSNAEFREESSREVRKRIDFFPDCEEGTQTIMHVSLIGGSLDKGQGIGDDDHYMNYIGFNGHRLTAYCDQINTDDNPNTLTADDCEIFNQDCGGYDITDWIKKDDDAVNFVVASATPVDPGQACDYSDDDDDAYADQFTWMLLINIHCSDTPVDPFTHDSSGAADHHHLGQSSHSVASADDSSFAATGVLVMVPFIGMVVGFTISKFFAKKPQFEAVVDGSAQASQKEFEFGTSSNYPPVRL